MMIVLANELTVTADILPGNSVIVNQHP